MKLKYKKLVETEVKFLKIDIPVRYEDDDIPFGFPFMIKQDDLDKEKCERWIHYGDHDRWIATVDLDSHKLIGWPEGKKGEFYTKVCDEGFYYLLDAEGNVIISIEQSYVPNKLIPPDDGYGDYINIEIDETGVITNWYGHPQVDEKEWDD